LRRAGGSACHPADGPVTGESRPARYSATMPSDPRPSARADDALDPGPRSRPVVASLLGVEALLLVITATYCFIGVSGGILDARFGVGLAVFLLLFALALGVAARSILVKGRFGLGFGITWQLFQALIGASLLRGALYWQGGLALLLAVAAIVLLTRLVRFPPLPGVWHCADAFPGRTSAARGRDASV